MPAENDDPTIDHPTDVQSVAEAAKSMAIKGIVVAAAGTAILYGAAIGALYLSRKGLAALSRHRSKEATASEIIPPPGSGSF